ncbi:defensin-1-like [Harpegnathos saltator]|nr:defensin-1-like [Harpegnathos saltator]
MRPYVFTASLVVVVTAVVAAPAGAFVHTVTLRIKSGILEDGYKLLKLLHSSLEERAGRYRRLTCEFSDSACSANCLSMGKAGGHCIDSNHIAICICDRRTISDLIRKKLNW